MSSIAVGNLGWGVLFLLLFGLVCNYCTLYLHGGYFLFQLQPLRLHRTRKHLGEESIYLANCKINKISFEFQNACYLL